MIGTAYRYGNVDMEFLSCPTQSRISLAGCRWRASRTGTAAVAGALGEEVDLVVDAAARVTQLLEQPDRASSARPAR